jgi:beta-glucosidase
MVLLRNENHTLPIELTQHPTILVVGENAIKMMTVGGGSSSLKAKYEISPLQGIQERAEGLAEVKYVRGYVGDIGGEYNGVTTGQSLQDDRTPEQLTAEAVEAAKSADYVVFVGGMNKAHNQDCEDGDRLHYELPYAQDQLISALAAVNDKVIFVSISGNAHGMPWNQEVEAILQAWYSGSETGHAVADVLFGDVNPSGKLPYTIQPTLADYPAHQYGEEAYPGVDKQVYYKEDIFVGYRYADLYGTRRPIKYVSQGKQYTINPPKHQALFPFGFGLSYTTFEYSKATLNGNQIMVSITNTGNRAGQEVVQLYITDSKASVVRPKKELKGFSKVALLPGETKQVTFTITPDMLSYFDADAHHWIAEEGLFVIHIASSSTDIHASLPYNYKK